MARSARIFISLLLCIALYGCLTAPSQEKVTLSLDGPSNAPRNLFVFLDGTRNDEKSATNVWKLHSLIQGAAISNRSTETIYIEGVGSVENPVLGMALGLGMENRILRAYQFLAERYRPNDKIYIFGFSRGAHQARDLAGLLSYAGLPFTEKNKDIDSLKTANRILEITKEKNDVDYAGQWREVSLKEKPPLSDEIRRRLNIKTIYAPVAFLGIWDTVPGSSFKGYSECKERQDRRNGDRYKTDSYPPIQKIVHAVSLDEKRSMFKPVLICTPIDPNSTKITEVWFPGAHADVGGGYEDSNELAKISLRWMVEQLAQSYPLGIKLFPESGNPLALSHWSVGDSPANFRSECVDRVIPRGAKIHPSAEDRTNARMAPVRIHGKVEDRPYPLMC